MCVQEMSAVVPFGKDAESSCLLIHALTLHPNYEPSTTLMVLIHQTAEPLLSTAELLCKHYSCYSADGGKELVGLSKSTSITLKEIYTCRESPTGCVKLCSALQLSFNLNCPELSLPFRPCLHHRFGRLKSIYRAGYNFMLQRSCSSQNRGCWRRTGVEQVPRDHDNMPAIRC